MKPREANEADIPRLLEMGERFFNAASFTDISFDRASTEGMFVHLISSPDGFILVDSEVTGMIGVLLFPMYFNLSYRAAQEVFWWSEGGGGLKLLEAAEEKAKDMGAKSFTMIHLESLTPDRLKRIYEKRGYVPRETHYTRSLWL